MSPPRCRSFPASRLLAATALLVPFVTLPPAWAGEAAEPDDFQPLTVDDASPLERGQGTADAALVWDRAHKEDLFEVRPRLRAGVAGGLELSLAAPYRFGEGDEADQADLEPGVQYQLTEGKGGWPTLAVEAAGTIPLGSHAGHEAELTFLATQPLGARGEEGPALHLNLSWSHLFDAGDDEREDRYAAVLGYSRPLGERTGLILDLVHEQEEDKGQATNLAEAGVRLELVDGLILSLGAGAGLGGDTPEVRVTAGLQRSFRLF